MPRHLILHSLLAIILATQATAAQFEWFPPEARESAAVDMAAKIAEIDLGTEVDDATRLQAARGFVADILSRLDEWGVEKLVEEAPDVSDLEFPPSDNRYLDAMARYGLCTYFLETNFADVAADADGPDFRLSAAMGLMSVSMVNLTLLHAYSEDGGSEEGFQTYFNSEAMNQFSQSLAENEGFLDYTSERCSPVLLAMLGKA